MSAVEIPPELAKLCELDHSTDASDDAKIAIQYLLQLHARFLCNRLAHAEAENELEKKQRKHNHWASKVSKRANELYTVLNRGEELCIDDSRESRD